MNTAVCYPVPLDNEDVANLFLPFIERFCRTWRKHPPGCAATVYAVCCNADAPQSVRDLFWGLPVTFCRYDGGGADLGAQQWLSKELALDSFQVNLTSRVYFHRAGWLAKLINARQLFGPNLYGTSISHEGGRLHLCTRCFAADSGAFAAYPHLLDSRDKGVFYEVGIDNPDGSLAEWFEARGFKPQVVYWDGTFPWRQVHHPIATPFQNCFRRGDQSQLLVFDKHSDFFRDAEPPEKDRLENLCYQGNQNENAGSGEGLSPPSMCPEPPP